MCNDHDLSLLTRSGKPARIAALCGVTSQYVSIWRRKGLNEHWRRYLALLDHLRTNHPAVSQECEAMLLRKGCHDGDAA